MSVGRLLPRLLAGVLLLAGTPCLASAQRSADASLQPAVRITSPLGRTGMSATIRIVAQVDWPAASDGTRRPLTVKFFVDGTLVGTATEGPPYAVPWIDENPFEARTIRVEAQDATGVQASADLALPAFEITDRTDVVSVVIDAVVHDSRGRAVTTLQSSDFGVLENGEEQAIELVTNEALPTTVLLLVDNSQSMARRFESVRRTAAYVARMLGKNDRVIVAPFNQRLGAITGPSTDAATIEQSISAMRPGGGTAILDALREGATLLDGLEGRRAIILISDGFDENSTIDPATTLQYIQAKQVAVYSVAVGGVTGVSLVGERMLRQLTETSGGRPFFPWRDVDIDDVVQAISADVHNRYLIAYTPSNHIKDGTWRAVTLSVPEGLKVRARNGYRAAAPPPIRPTLEFRVTDGTAHVASITADQLEVLEDGAPQIVDTFQEAIDPVSIVLLLDASGSMRRSAEAVKQAARDFVAAVRREDSLALVTFADQATLAHVLTTNRDLTLAGINRYVAEGGTALYDGLWEGLTHLRTAPGRRAIVVLTDGRDENNAGTAAGSTRSLDDVLALRREVGATVFTVGLGTRVAGEVLSQLARTSGGATYQSMDTSELAERFRGVVENLRQRYVLSYTATNPKRDGQWRTVEIKPKSAGFTVTAPGGYFAPQP